MKAGYTSREIVSLLRMSRQAIKQSGLLDVLKRTDVFGRRHALYDKRDVEKWSSRLARRRGLIALGRLPRNYPILSATGRAERCPRCGSASVSDPEDSRRYWCEQCGLQEKPGE